MPGRSWGHNPFHFKPWELVVVVPILVVTMPVIALRDRLFGVPWRR